MDIKMYFSVASLLAILIFPCVESANILFYFGCAGYSHRISIWPIVEALASTGHKITFLSPFENRGGKIPHPNIIDIVPKGMLAALSHTSTDYVSLRINGGVAAADALWPVYHEATLKACESAMNDAETLGLIDNPSFDLIVINAFNECAYGIVDKLKIPFVVYSSTSHMPWFKDGFGHVDENFPEMDTHYGNNPTFIQRTKNLLSSLTWEWKKHWSLYPRYAKIAKDALGLSELPDLSAIEKNASLVLINQHFSEEYPRSIPPNVQNIGGIHISNKRNPLPKDVEDFIATADEGFIYLSFGTYATLSNLPQHLQNAFFDAAAKFPNIKFIIKYKGDPPEGLGENIKTVSWINQQDIIAHPKVRLFIGHGGLLSMQEAIYHGVPMIIFPIFVEQDFNAVRAHERGTAIALELGELTEDKLVAAINQILNDKKFKERTTKLSKLFRDRDMQPLEKAVWWIEYVIRHKGDTSHLLPVGTKRTWYERRMLDIWGFLAVTFVIVVTLICAIFFTICKKIFGTTAKRNKAKAE